MGDMLVDRKHVEKFSLIQTLQIESRKLLAYRSLNNPINHFVAWNKILYVCIVVVSVAEFLKLRKYECIVMGLLRQFCCAKGCSCN